MLRFWHALKMSTKWSVIPDNGRAISCKQINLIARKLMALLKNHQLTGVGKNFANNFIDNQSLVVVLQKILMNFLAL